MKTIDAIVKSTLYGFAENYRAASTEHERYIDDRAVQELVKAAIEKPADRMKYYRFYLSMRKSQ